VQTNHGRGRIVGLALGLGVAGLAAVVGLTAAPGTADAGWPWGGWWHHHACDGGCADGAAPGDVGGTWYWLRSPDEEKRVVSALYNRYCIRCHGVDGRGVWDMPDIPNFTNARWQACRSDDQLARIILEGRGAVMPPFRGTLTVEEAWAMARYLRTFVPGSEASRPDLGQPDGGKGPAGAPAPQPGKPSQPMPEATRTTELPGLP
jgi:mono/diheme cytochrome c family protein